MNDVVFGLQEQLRSELNSNSLPRRIRINSVFYHELSPIIDEFFNSTTWGLDIIEDPMVSGYKIEY